MGVDKISSQSLTSGAKAWPDLSRRTRPSLSRSTGERERNLDIRLDGSEVAKNLREARQHIAPGRVYPAAAMPEVDGKASVGVIEEDEAILSGDPQEIARELRSSLITVGKTAGDEVSLHRFVDSDVLDEAARDDDIETVSLERNLERIGRMQERAAGPLLPLAMP